MHLKKLKLRNFKSFAGAIEVPFEPGYTGVAGPNGMGKSNISDGILFVLGPKSSKALRADRLTHLFFNGGASKKPATECEVSLVFDNADRLLPVDSDEVEVTRYVKLAPSDPDGYYSYFYVNGKRTTQTDIDSILSHAGLSGDGYNLVQQGDVNSIVTMGPVPRRGLLERLAGISQFDDELGRAQTKRTDLDANLDRIRTLLGEIKSRISSLESQRLQAIQYRQLEEEKHRAEARLARAGQLMAQQEFDTCQTQVKTLQEEIQKLDAERLRLTQERDELVARIDVVDREIAKAGGEAAEKIRAERDQKRLALATLQMGLDHQKEALQTLETRTEELAGLIKSDEKDIARFRAEESKASRELAEVSKRSDEISANLQESTGGSGHAQGKLAGAKKQVLELQRRQTDREKAWQAAVQERESLKAKVEGAERAEAQAEDTRREREVEVRDFELRIKEANPDGTNKGGSTGDLQKELFQLKTKEKALTAEADRLGQEVTELNRRYMALDARLKARSESNGRNSPFAAVDFLLSQRNLGKLQGIRGTVSELVQYDSKHRLGLEIAGGSRFHALVVETDAVAEECIRLLRTERRGRATFLPLNKMLPARPKGKSLIAAQATGAVGFAIDLVKFDESLRPAISYVFGETVVMDDLTHARAQMGGVRLVTLTGDLIEATGAISGGYIDASGKSADNASELKQIGEELREKSAADSAARAELAKVSTRIREVSEELAKRSIRADAHQSTRQILDKELAQARLRLKESVDLIRASQKEHEEAGKEFSALEASATKLAEEIAALKTEIAKAQEQYLGQLPGALSTRVRQWQQEAQETSDARVKLNGELQSIRANLGALSERLAGRRSELSTAQQELAAKHKEIAASESALVQSKAGVDALKGIEEQQGAAFRVHAEKKKKLDGQRLTVTESLARAEATLTNRQTMLQQEEVRLAQAEAKLHEVQEALKQFPEPAADEKPIPIEELKRTLAATTVQLESMGSVNLLALEEYDQEKARLDEFDSESQRLSSEKGELLGLVKEIEQKKREKISEVVVRVNTAYVEIYRELTRGGEGEIALENPKDPLAGGLLIKARPIGKNVQRLEQLSGGEKSIASLAFIFAMQRYEPSPLYVFDEIDMSLDGINAEHVGRMLQRDSQRAQFIVISLRKVTLKFAHRLYGVTMRGDGCSRVYGITLEDIQDVEERDGAHAPPLASVAAGAS
jgi:chromosome segregation protein